MAQLVGLIVSEDDTSKSSSAGCCAPARFRSASWTSGRPRRHAAGLIIVDMRGDASSAMSTIERLRAGAPGAGIFAVASAADPELILQSMRAGANEFFTWPPAEETFHGAIRRTAARRETAQGARPSATTLVFFGAKGGAGTTTMAVNCGVELARLSKRSTVIVDLKPGLGEVALFLGVRPRYSMLDAIDNLHRLDREFLQGARGEAQVGARDSRRLRSVRSAGRGRRRRDRRAVPAARAAVRVHPRRRRQPDQFVHGRGALHRRHDLPGRQPGRAVGAQRAAAARSRAPARRLRRARARAAQSRGGAVSDSAEADRSARSAIRFITRSRATTRRCRPRSTRACRWR